MWRLVFAVVRLTQGLVIAACVAGCYWALSSLPRVNEDGAGFAAQVGVLLLTAVVVAVFGSAAVLAVRWIEHRYDDASAYFRDT